MTLSRLQKAELKKIQSSYKKIERFSSENSFSLDEFAERDFHFDNKAEEKRRQTFEQNLERRSVYESERKNNRAF